jgi:hypothetical protein
MPAPTKPQALRRAVESQERLNNAEAKATELALKRDSAVLDAQELAGCTYPEIREATGLSIARITQVLRKERERRRRTL